MRLAHSYEAIQYLGITSSAYNLEGNVSRGRDDTMSSLVEMDQTRMVKGTAKVVTIPQDELRACKQSQELGSLLVGLIEAIAAAICPARLNILSGSEDIAGMEKRSIAIRDRRGYWRLRRSQQSPGSVLPTHSAYSSRMEDGEGAGWAPSFLIEVMNCGLLGYRILLDREGSVLLPYAPLQQSSAELSHFGHRLQISPPVIWQMHPKIYFTIKRQLPVISDHSRPGRAGSQNYWPRSPLTRFLTIHKNRARTATRQFDKSSGLFLPCFAHTYFHFGADAPENRNVHSLTQPGRPPKISILTELSTIPSFVRVLHTPLATFGDDLKGLNSQSARLVMIALLLINIVEVTAPHRALSDNMRCHYRRPVNGLKATPLNPLVNSTANPLAFFSAYIRRGWNDVTSTQSAFTVTEAMMRKGRQSQSGLFFRAEKKSTSGLALDAATYLIVAPSLSPQASRLLKLLPPNPPSNEFKMGQYSSVNPHELNTGIIIEFFNTVWPKLDEDIKMLVLHQLRAKEPQNFEPNPPLIIFLFSFHSLRTRAPPPEPVPPHNPIAKSPTFTPLPEVVKLHFAKSCQDPAKFFDQSDNGETPTNPFHCGAYLALVQNKNIAWIGHIQIRFLTVGFHELELHLRETCQKLQPNRWPNRPEDENSQRQQWRDSALTIGLKYIEKLKALKITEKDDIDPVAEIIICLYTKPPLSEDTLRRSLKRKLPQTVTSNPTQDKLQKIRKSGVESPARLVQPRSSTAIQPICFTIQQTDLVTLADTPPLTLRPFDNETNVTGESASHQTILSAHNERPTTSSIPQNFNIDFNTLSADGVFTGAPAIEVDVNALDPDDVLTRSALIDVDFNVLDPDAVMAQSPLIDVDFNILDPDAVMAQSPLIDVDFNILDPDALMQPLSAEYNSPELGAAPELIFNPAYPAFGLNSWDGSLDTDFPGIADGIYARSINTKNGPLTAAIASQPPATIQNLRRATAYFDPKQAQYFVFLNVNCSRLRYLHFLFTIQWNIPMSKLNRTPFTGVNWNDLARRKLPYSEPTAKLVDIRLLHSLEWSMLRMVFLRGAHVTDQKGTFKIIFRPRGGCLKIADGQSAPRVITSVRTCSTGGNLLMPRIEDFPPPSAQATWHKVLLLEPPRINRAAFRKQVRDQPGSRASQGLVQRNNASSKLELNAIGLQDGGDQRNVNHEVVNQVDVNQLNPTQRSQFLLINQLNIITILSWYRRDVRKFWG
ncbi:hypothetical protein HRG_012350 [Hirsutella rhossiliensis]